MANSGNSGLMALPQELRDEIIAFLVDDIEPMEVQIIWDQSRSKFKSYFCHEDMARDLILVEKNRLRFRTGSRLAARRPDQTLPPQDPGLASIFRLMRTCKSLHWQTRLILLAKPFPKFQFTSIDDMGRFFQRLHPDYLARVRRARLYLPEVTVNPTLGWADAPILSTRTIESLQQNILSAIGPASALHTLETTVLWKKTIGHFPSTVSGLLAQIRDFDTFLNHVELSILAFYFESTMNQRIEESRIGLVATCNHLQVNSTDVFEENEESDSEQDLDRQGRRAEPASNNTTRAPNPREQLHWVPGTRGDEVHQVERTIVIQSGMY